MADLDYGDLGFWQSLGRLRISQVVRSWDLPSAILVAVGVAALTPGSKQADVSGDFLVVSGALVGVVIAGLGVVLAMMNRRYALVLQASGTHPADILGHFIVVAGLTVGSLVSSVGFRAIESVLPASGSQFAFGLATFLFAYALFSSVELVKLMLGMALTRTGLEAIDGPDAVRRTDTG